MNVETTKAYLSMSDAELTTIGLVGLANNREVAKAFVAGGVVEGSSDGVLYEVDLDPEWVVDSFYRIQVLYSSTVATKFVSALTSSPSVGTTYYSPTLTDVRKYLIYSWIGSEGDALRLGRGLVHPTIESAVQHTGALLNVESVK